VAVLRGTRRLTLRDGRAVAVRSATPGDARELAQLVDAVAAEPETWLLMVPGQRAGREWKKQIAQAAADPGSLLLAAILEGRMVGNLGLRPDPHRASAHVVVLGMSVLADVRGAGVGTALLQTALTWAGAHGGAKATLSVFPHNRRAIAFYERHGFETEGLRRRQFVRQGRALDELLMARFLDGSEAAPSGTAPVGS
jgi:RimJ/RimL family protein N-acetyltransferase